MDEVSYEAAGVSLATAEAIVDRLKSAVESTWAGGATGTFGAFAGLYDIGGDRLLAASTDGVGTKLMLQKKAGKLRWAGADLAAHCVNDVATTGARPLFFLDYVAANSIETELVLELVEGAAEICRDAGCAILGGETAELPGIYKEGEFDFAGTCVGVVDRADLVDGSRCEEGDAVVGFRSAGIHANGFTLVRSLIGDGEFDAELLLPPTKLYLSEIDALRARADVRAMAHITGGGIPGNLSRVLPAGLGARIDAHSWERGPVYDWLDAQDVPEEEQRRVFNLGIGFCCVIPAADAGPDDLVIGRLERGLEGVVLA